MKSTIKSMAVAFGFMLGLVACDDTSAKNPITNIREAAADTDLQSKIFRGDCDVKVATAIFSGLATGLKDSLKSARSQWQFVGANFTLTTSFYETANCQGDEALVYKETGSFDISQDQRGEDRSKAIDLKSDKLTVAATSDAGLRVAREAKLCGRENWEKDKPVEITGQAKDGTCYGKALPAEEANVYRLDGNTLYFGKHDQKGENRPQKVDENARYIAN